MTTFIERIKNNLAEQRHSHINIQTRREDLRELLYHFERLDAEARAQYSQPSNNSNQRLHDAIVAAYHNNHRDTERTMLVITETLTKIFKEKLKSEINFDFNKQGRQTHEI